MNRYSRIIPSALFLSLALCVGLSGQTVQLADQQNWESRIFPLKYVDANDLRVALSMFRAEIGPPSNLGVISVRAPKEVMPALEDAIKRLDVPLNRKSVELTVYVLSASNKVASTSSMPLVLQPVVNQLKSVFSYTDFLLLDTIVVRGIEGKGAQTRGVLPQLTNASAQAFYDFESMLHVRMSDEKSPTVELDQMEFDVRVPIPTNSSGSFQYIDVNIRTNIEIPLGQQVVVGKATVMDSALILVMNARILD